MSEKIVALDEEVRALRLEASEAEARSEALGREKGQVQELATRLQSEVADKMALLDEFEAKFARQYRWAAQGWQAGGRRASKHVSRRGMRVPHALAGMSMAP